MRKITLKRLGISNFKGCKNLSLDFKDFIISILGPNASGKTTILDAYTWVMFGKDSAGNSSFGIRPVDKDGNEIDNIEICVTADFEVDGTLIGFKKVQKQKWTKHRGSSAPTYEGNVNTYEVNGFPVSEKEYKAKIAEILTEDNFRLVSDIRYFSSLKWEEKIKLLLSLCGNVTDEDVLKEDPDKWLPIKADVMTAGTEKSKQKAQKELREYNKTQKELPVRIDELSMQLKDNVATAELEAEIKAINAELEALPLKVVAKTDADEKRLEWLKSEMERIAANVRRSSDEAYHALQDKRLEIEKAKQGLFDAQREVQNLKDRNASIVVDAKTYAEKYHELKGQELDEKSSYCNTCGQILPSGKLKEIKAQFEERKKKAMNVCAERHKALKEESKAILKELAVKEKHMSEMSVKIAKLNEDADALEQKYENSKIPTDDIPELVPMKEEIASIEKKIADKVSEAEIANQERERKTWMLMERRNAAQNELAQAKVVNSTNTELKERIEALEESQRDIGQKIALSEQKVILLEEFGIRKSELLSKKITDCFEMTNFALFNKQINGGVTETCEITLNGVRYKDMNSGHRIVVALDIIKTFQKKLGINAPVFIDNAESVNDFNLPKMDCQLILLKVSDDKKLVVKTGGAVNA